MVEPWEYCCTLPLEPGSRFPFLCKRNTSDREDLELEWRCISCDDAVALSWPDGGERMGKGGKKRGNDAIGLLGTRRMG